MLRLQEISFMPIYQYQCAQCRHSLEPLISACAVSTERANLSAAHRKVTAARGDRLRDQHQHVYEHFEDGAAGPPEWYANHGVKGNGMTGRDRQMASPEASR
jgi:hypothetical protein